jgi:ribokinase
MPVDWKVVVFGPAYLDRVLTVDEPILEGVERTPIDRSFDGREAPISEGGSELALTLNDGSGRLLSFEVPINWPGPRGLVTLSEALAPNHSVAASVRKLTTTGWHEDLGGMGAGYAKAMGGLLVSALGEPQDAMSRTVSRALTNEGLTHLCVPVNGQKADWTLLITSGAFGDKLPIGFRGCHAALRSEMLPLPEDVFASTPDGLLLIVAGLPNALGQEILRTWTLRQERARPEIFFRFLAPAMRNVKDVETPIGRLAPWIDGLSCNREEWQRMTDTSRNALDAHARVLLITDGEHGVFARSRPDIASAWTQVRLPAFPRARPPTDTNRAGEAFASSFLTSVLQMDDPARLADPIWLEEATRRGTVAAALVIDLARFAFPTMEEIDAALAAGMVG